MFLSLSEALNRQSPSAFVNAEDERLWNQFRDSGWTQLPTKYIRGLHRLLNKCGKSNAASSRPLTAAIDSTTDDVSDIIFQTVPSYEEPPPPAVAEAPKYSDETESVIDLDLSLDFEHIELSQLSYDLRWLWDTDPTLKARHLSAAQDADYRENDLAVLCVELKLLLSILRRTETWKRNQIADASADNQLHPPSTEDLIASIL